MISSWKKISTIRPGKSSGNDEMAPLRPVGGADKEKDFTKQQRNRSRVETNLIRLLSRCEDMAMDTETLQDDWRLDKVSVCTRVTTFSK